MENKFKERLCEILKTTNTSQTELAKKINMSQSIVNNYCTGKREPSLNALILIAQVLDETTDYLLGLTDF